MGTRIKKNLAVAEDYKKGKDAALQFLVGQGMKISKGKANPGVLQKLLREKLAKVKNTSSVSRRHFPAIARFCLQKIKTCQSFVDDDMFYPVDNMGWGHSILTRLFSAVLINQFLAALLRGQRGWYN